MKTLYIDNAHCDLDGKINVDRSILNLDDIDYQVVLRSVFRAEVGEMSYRLNALEMVRDVSRVFCGSSDVTEWHKISLLVNGLSFEMAINREGFAKIRNVLPDDTEVRVRTSSIISCFDNIIKYCEANIVYHSDESTKSVIELLDNLSKSVSELNQAVCPG